MKSIAVGKPQNVYNFGWYHKLTLFLIFLFFTSSPLYAELDTLRIVTYNLLKFPGSFGTERVEHFRKVINAIDPDILVVQELESQAGQNIILSQILNYNSNEYQAVPFVDGYDMDNSLFYKYDKILLLGSIQIRTGLRDISQYDLLFSNIYFEIYSVHLKASEGTINENKRLRDATTLRNHLNQLSPNTNFLVVGDFNFYRSSEPGFIELTENQANDNGRLFDPINKLGDWHINAFFSKIHTQSTRFSGFGDGAGGGLDDRFDLVLVSSSIMSPGGMFILSNTYNAYGNDGEHLDDSVNYWFNNAVSMDIANSLYEASDHLPVYADFVFGNISSVDNNLVLPDQFKIFQNYPNPFNSQTAIPFNISFPADVTLSVFDLAGRLVKTISKTCAEAGHYSINWNSKDISGGDVASGIYIYTIKAGIHFESRKFLLIR